MIEALVVSNLALWILVIVLAAVAVALARQVGLLHERLAPAGALAPMRGPEVGEPAPELFVTPLRGEPFRIGGPDELGRATLLFFASPTCPVCKTLLPTFERVLAAERGRVVGIVASDGDAGEIADFADRHGLDPARTVLSPELGLRFAVEKLPYAVLIDAEGRLRAKGIVNTREHLESLFEAERLGVATIQEHLANEDLRGAEGV